MKEIRELIVRMTEENPTVVSFDGPFRRIWYS